MGLFIISFHMKYMYFDLKKARDHFYNSPKSCPTRTTPQTPISEKSAMTFRW